MLSFTKTVIEIKSPQVAGMDNLLAKIQMVTKHPVSDEVARELRGTIKKDFFCVFLCVFA